MTKKDKKRLKMIKSREDRGKIIKLQKNKIWLKDERNIKADDKDNKKG